MTDDDTTTRLREAHATARASGSGPGVPRDQLPIGDPDPLDVACPRCGAQPRSDALPAGEHCRTASGRHDTQSHKARHAAAAAATRQDPTTAPPDDEEPPVPDDHARTADAAASGLTIPEEWHAGPPQLAVEADEADLTLNPPAEEEERIPTDPAFRKARLRAQRRRDTPDEATPPTPTPTIPDDVYDDLARRIAEQVGPAHPLGQTVWFRSRTGRWTAPATITATSDSLYQPNVDAGHLPALSSDEHVHLTVLTPGIQGHVSAETAEQQPELVADDRPNKPAGGTFQEWDCPRWAPDDGDVEGFEWADQPAGTWMWPL